MMNQNYLSLTLHCQCTIYILLLTMRGNGAFNVVQSIYMKMVFCSIALLCFNQELVHLRLWMEIKSKEKMWEISEYKYITSKSKLNCCMYNCLLYFIFSDVLNEFSLTLVPKFYFDIETLLHTCDNEQFTLVYACEKNQN